MLALLSLVLVLVLPAVAAWVALSDERIEVPPAGDHPSEAQRPGGRDLSLARGLACGVATWLIGSGLLARTVGLTVTTAWLWDGLAATASVTVLLMPRQRARLRSMWRPALGRCGAGAGLSALVFLPVAFVILRTAWSPFGSTPWYYYGLARQVAEAGRIPATSVEFATTTPFLNDYHLFTTGTAMLLLQQPGDPIAVITIVTLVGVLLLGYGVVALGSALGADRLTVLITIPLALSTGIGAMRLSAYRPEGFALGLVVLVVALSIDWYRRRAWESLATAGILIATLSQVHGIAALTTGVMVLAAALAHVAHGPRSELRRAGISLVVYAGAFGVTGLVFQGASGTGHAGGLVNQGGLADPTWEFYRIGRSSLPLLPPSNGQMLYDVPGYLYGGSWWWVTVILVLAGVGLWRRRRDPDTRLLVAFIVLTMIGLAVVAAVFMFGWDGYVPRRTGASRIPLEASLLVPAFIAVGLGCLAQATWRWRGRAVPERRRRPIMLTAVVACALVSSVGVARYNSTQALSRNDLAVWRSLPLKHDDVVLTNAYTEGFIPDVTDAQGLLDGRAPYTFGDLLHRANSLFSEAQGFFADPSAHWGFLRANDISWVIVGKASTFALSTGNAWAVPGSLDALERCGGLQRVADDDPSITVFRVVDATPAGCRSRPKSP
jgi:hypothetical protein